MSTVLQSKMVTCQCGHMFETAKVKVWCEKCCHPVFYFEKDQRRHKRDTYYFTAVILAAITFVSYLFVEMVAGPLLSRF